MAWIAGVDGCKGGWIAVYAFLKDGEITDMECHVEVCDGKGEHAKHKLSCAFEAVMACPAPLDAVAVGMPIGLSEEGYRACDKAARDILGKRSSSIFSTPAAGLLRDAKLDQLGRVDYYEKANKLNKKLTNNAKEQEGKGLSRQSWALVPKIAEVARYVDTHRKEGRRIHEAHPEVSFAAMRSGKAWSFDPMHHPKKTFGGLVERRALITAFFGARFEEFEARAVDSDAVGRVAPDDFYDAAACLWTARRVYGKKAHVLPNRSRVGSVSLPMRIVY